MLSEPQSITIGAVVKPLPRVAMGDRTGTFEDLAAGLRFRVTHTVGRRNRSVVRLDVTKTAADPLLDGVSRQYSMSVTSSSDTPPVGFSATEVTDAFKALATWLNTPANLAKLVNGES